MRLPCASLNARSRTTDDARHCYAHVQKEKLALLQGVKIADIKPVAIIWQSQNKIMPTGTQNGQIAIQSENTSFTCAYPSARLTGRPVLAAEVLASCVHISASFMFPL